MADIDVTGIYDEVTVSEDIDFANDLSIDTYSTISVAETKIATVMLHWSADATILFPWKLVASFTSTFQGSSLLPTWDLSSVSTEDPDIKVSRFAMVLREERIGVRELSASMSEAVVYTGDSTIPVRSLSGAFGSQMESYSPFWELSSTLFEAGVFSLDDRISLHRLTASFYEEPTMQLNTYSIPWSFEGNMLLSEDHVTLDVKIPGALILSASYYEEITFSVDSDIPVWTLAGSMIDDSMRLSSNIPGAYFLDALIGTGGVFSLDTNIPVRSLSGYLHSESIEVSSYIPIWTLTALLSETAIDVDPDGDIQDDSFIGVLRYIRP